MKNVRKSCKDVDQRFNKITSNALSMGEIDYFTLHDVYSKLKDLPQFESSDFYMYNFYTRNFLEWDVDKRKDLKKLIGLEDDMSNMKTA